MRVSNEPSISQSSVGRNNQSNTDTLSSRPRPQRIAGTPAPDTVERPDLKLVQQTCALFGLDTVRSLTTS